MTTLVELVASELLKPSASHSFWETSPFFHLSIMHPKTKGTRFEAITKDLLTKLGHKVTARTHVSHDMVVDSWKCEVKGSMLNADKAQYSFLQIRPEDEYEKLLLLCIRPHSIRLFSLTKGQVLEGIKNDVLRKQHGGKRGDGLTYCLYTDEEGLLALGATEYGETPPTDNGKAV